MWDVHGKRRQRRALSREGIFISGISVQTNNSSLVSGNKYEIIDPRGLELEKLLLRKFKLKLPVRPDPILLFQRRLGDAQS